MKKHLLIFFQLLIFGVFSFAQTNITVSYSPGSYDEENSWQLYNVTADSEIDCYSEATTGAYSQSYVIPAGNIIELRAWETYGDEWSGATITLTNDDASFTHYSGPTTANGNGAAACGTNDTTGDIAYSGDPGIVPLPPDCPGSPIMPLDNATDIPTVVTLEWTPASTGDPATSYDIYFGTTSGALTFLSNVTGTSATISGLLIDTEYFWHVNPVNSAGSNDCSVNEYSFTTIPPPPSPTGVTCTSGSPAVLYSDELDNQGSWTGDFGTTDGNWQFGSSTGSSGTGPTSPQSGSNFMFYEASGNVTNTAVILSPVIDLSIASEEAELTFYIHAYGGGIGTFEIGASSSASGPFTNLWTWTGSIQGAQGDPFTQVGFDVSSFVGGDLYLEIKHTGAGDFEGDIAIDLLEINSCSTCSPVSGLSADNVADITAELNWTDGAGCSANNTITVTPSITGSPFTVPCGTETFSLTGLTAATAYTVDVENDCGTTATSVSFSTFNLGEVCEAAIEVSSLPFNDTDNTNNYGNNYSGSPGSSCGSTSSYLGGDDVVYSYTPSSDELVDISLTGIGTYTGIFIYEDCADIGTTCFAGDVNGSVGGSILLPGVSLLSGQTYYIVISTWPSPDNTAYTLDISIPDNCTTLNTPTDGSTDVALECGGDVLISWTAPSGVTPDSYNVYSGITSGSLSLAGNSSTTDFILTGLSTSTVYYYEVRPIISGVEEASCQESSFTTTSNIVDSGSGGTNNVYYFANNNNNVGTPSGDFQWDDPVALNHIEVTSTTGGTLDDGYITVQLPFTFKYYGVDYTECHIGTNGYLSFGSGFSSTGGGVVLGSTSDPDNMIALAMMDLDDNADGKIYHGPIDGSTYAITWWHYHDYGDANEYITMQLILQKNPVSTENGVFEMRYNQAETSASIPDFLADAVIGCEDIEANAATEYASYRENGTGGPMFCSPLTIGFGPTEASVNLPLELVEFKGEAMKEYNRLSWISLNEFNTSHFEIERSIDGKTWRKIGDKEANNYTDYTINYSFDDYFTGSKAYYRLKMYDLDNTFSFSDIISLTRENVKSDVTIYPNPTNADINVAFNSTSVSEVTLRITDLSGRIIFEKSDITNRGLNSVNINTDLLTSGMYFVQMELNGESTITRFIKE